MRAAAILAGSLVAIGAYLFIASFTEASPAVIGIGVLSISMIGAIAGVASTPSQARRRAA
jgi:hypothetical protein